MANKKYSIDAYKDRWTSPIVSDWHPPKTAKKTTETKKKVTKKKVK